MSEVARILCCDKSKSSARVSDSEHDLVERVNYVEFYACEKFSIARDLPIADGAKKLLPHESTPSRRFPSCAKHLFFLLKLARTSIVERKGSFVVD